MLWHFVQVFLYANPLAPKQPNTIATSHRYVYPFFEQNWNLFVPPPNSNYKLYVYSADRSLGSRELLGEILGRHQGNRLKGYEPLLIALVNSIHYFEKAAMLDHIPQGKVSGSLYFSIVERFAQNYLKHFYREDLTNKKLLLEVTDRSQNRRVYCN